MKIVESLWASYYARVLLGSPNEQTISPVQIKETRRAFYAGCHAIISGLFNTLDSPNLPTLEDAKMLEQIQGELQQFVKDVTDGRA